MFSLRLMISGLEEHLVFRNVADPKLGTIDSVLLYDRNEALFSGCFYVCSGQMPPAEDVFLPNDSWLIFSEVEPGRAEAAAAHPAAALGFSLSTAAVLNRLSRNHSQFVHFIERLRDTDDLQAIADLTSEAAGCPVCIVNSFCEKIAISEGDSHESEIFRQLSGQGKLSLNTAQELMVNEKDNEGSEVTTLPSGGAYVTDYVIRYNEQAITRVLIECGSADHREHCAPYLDEMLRRIRPIILAYDTVGSLEKDQINTLISGIIDRDITDAEEIEQKAALALRSLQGRYYQPIVIKMRKRVKKIPLNYISGQLVNICPGSVVAQYNRSLVVLCTKKNLTDSLDFNEQSLLDLLEEFDAYAGIGECTHYLTTLSILYVQAAATARLGSILCPDPTRRIFRYRDYSPYFLVDLCIDDMIKHYKFGNVSYLCDPGIIQLLRYDAKYGTDLESTLRRYVRFRCNAKQCAESMGVHRNTVINRVRVIEEQIDGSLSDPDMYLKVVLSLKTLDYQREYMGQDPLDMMGRSIDVEYWDNFAPSKELM